MASSRPTHIDLPKNSTSSFDQSQLRQPSPRDLPSPRSGEVPPPLSPLDAFAFQSRILAQQFRQQNEDGRPISRLPPLTASHELARPRQNYFGAKPTAATAPFAPPAGPAAIPEDEAVGSLPPPSAANKADAPSTSGVTPEFTSQSDWRPKSYYPFIQNFDDASSIASRDSTISNSTITGGFSIAQSFPHPIPEETPMPQPQGRTEPAIPMSAPAPAPLPVTAPVSAPQPSHSTDSLHLTRSLSPDSAMRQPRAEFSNRLALPPKRQAQSQRKNLAVDAGRSPSPLGLTPPRSPGMHSLRNQPSIRSVRMDPADDSDAHSLLSEPFEGRERKQSASSAYSRPRSPFSPPLGPPPRSPSAMSELSDGRPLPRGSINFSRPISRNERPSGEMSRPSLEQMRAAGNEPKSPRLRPSLDALSLNDAVYSPTFISPPFSDYNSRTFAASDPNFHSERPFPAPSYIYSKYSLPRGRELPQELQHLQNGQLQQQQQQQQGTGQLEETHRFEWSQPVSGTNVTPIRDSQSQTQTLQLQDEAQAESQRGRISNTTLTALDLPMGDPAMTPPIRTRSADDSSPAGKAAKTHRSSPSFPPPTISSAQQAAALGTLPAFSHNAAAKVRPATSHGTRPARPGFANLGTTPGMSESSAIEDHLNKGIECHEQGELQKSTYHLRIAARGGSVTAMLLYALACRHGWGTRPNQAEGVVWLRRAVDSAGLEVAGDEAATALDRSSIAPAEQLAKHGVSSASASASVSASASGAAPTSVMERKTHKALLALSIYELGMSYMNGWGIGQDKALGLRCFEIAGGWGDADALAEAGFCFAKGVGCKKDLHKAAEFYRRAEAGGMSMAGNSWIYKDKYMPKAKKTSLEDNARQSKDDERDRDRGRDSRDKDRDQDRDAGRGRDKEPKDKDKKTARDKSRTRTIFGGRKKVPLE